jgi:hypothetical protein
MKNILITGDSFAYGHGCSDRVFYYDEKLRKHIGDSVTFQQGPSEHCWASLLQNELNVNVINVSVPGSSNQGAYMRAIEKINPDYDLVIFAGTWTNRTEIASHVENKTKSIIFNYSTANENDPLPYKNSIISYFKYLYHEDINRHTSITSIVSLYSYCLKHNIKFLWTFPRNEHLCDKLEHVIVNHRMFSMQDELFGQRDKMILDISSITDVSGHFNDIGHKIYYEAQIKNRVIDLLNL